jgi:hypothetical protein
MTWLELYNHLHNIANDINNLDSIYLPTNIYYSYRYWDI